MTAALLCSEIIWGAFNKVDFWASLHLQNQTRECRSPGICILKMLPEDCEASGVQTPYGEIGLRDSPLQSSPSPSIPLPRGPQVYHSSLYWILHIRPFVFTLKIPTPTQRSLIRFAHFQQTHAQALPSNPSFPANLQQAHLSLPVS